MGRLKRTELQARNRARVLVAAREEFAERGFRDAKVDTIAERADLTRGAVYSNFPSKRALYFTVLADLAERDPTTPVEPGETPATALAAFAFAWLNRLADPRDDRTPAPLSTDLVPEVLAEENAGQQYAQLLKLNAILLGVALEQLRDQAARDRGGVGGRLVRVAEMVLTTLHGAGELVGAAPGFVQPLTVAKACAQLTSLEVNDHWEPPPTHPQVRPADEPWTPPLVVDTLRRHQARLGPDGLFVALGMNRLAAAEDAVRAASKAGTRITVALVSDRPTELGPLARLTVNELLGCLRQGFPESAWPALQLVDDESGDFTAALGADVIANDLEYAVRVVGGRIVARAEGFGATHAAALAHIPTPATIEELR